MHNALCRQGMHVIDEVVWKLMMCHITSNMYN